MHADQFQALNTIHGGIVPESWAGGPFEFQKAKVIAALAWHLVKPAEDPELPACDTAHQETLTAIVEDIMRGSEPDPTLFAQTAHRLWRQANQPPPPSPPKEELTNGG